MIHVKFVRVAIKVRLQLAVDLLGPLSEPFLPQFVAKFVVRHFESVPLPHLSDGWTMTDRVESPSEPVVVGPSFGLHSGALAQEMRVGLRGRRS